MCVVPLDTKEMFMLQRLREKEGTLESVCGEMHEKKAHYERRIGELSGKHNDANNRIKLLEVYCLPVNYISISCNKPCARRNIEKIGE